MGDCAACVQIFASDDFLELTEYSREEVLGRNCRFAGMFDLHTFDLELQRVCPLQLHLSAFSVHFCLLVRLQALLIYGGAVRELNYSLAGFPLE